MIKVFPGYKAVAEKELEEIKKFVNHNHAVLDVGCGFGRAMKELAPFCEKVVGIDVDSKEIEIAKDYLKGIENVGLFVGNATKTSFPPESFDIILLLGNTFGNVGKEKYDVLEEMKRLLNLQKKS